MLKTVRGKAPGHFGSAEASLTLNWVSLVTGLVIAAVTWIGTDLIPYLHDSGGASAGILGLLTVSVPMVLNWLKDNRNIQVEKTVTPKK